MYSQSILVTIMALASTSAALAEEIKVVSGGTCYNQVFKKVMEAYVKQTQTKIILVGDVNTNSTGKIFKTVEAGGAEAGCTAGNWRDAPGALKKENIEIPGINNYQSQVIGFDRLQVYVHKANTLKTLSDLHLEQIFSGKVINWKQIGGADEPISLVYSPSQGALLFFFEKKILGGKKLAKASVSPENMAQIVPAVAKTPGTVGLTSYGFGDESVVAVKHSEIGRPLNLFTKSKPSEPLRKFLVWINNEGKALIYK